MLLFLFLLCYTDQAAKAADTYISRGEKNHGLQAGIER